MKKSERRMIAKFMGLDFITVGYTGTDSETRWQRKNRDWFDKHYEFHDNSVGDYAVNIDEDVIIWQDDLAYDSDWNMLMPVVEKISTKQANVQMSTNPNRCLISYNTFDTDHWTGRIYVHTQHLGGAPLISCVYKACLDYIKWHNETQKK